MNTLRKTAVVRAMNKLVSERIESAISSLSGLTESRNTASKSTAGDKHETGRAMMEAEIQRAEQQLQKVKVLKNEMNNIPWRKRDVVGSGAWVRTNQGEFLISVGLGKVEVSDTFCFALSGASPLGQALQGSQVGDCISFRNRAYEILEIQ